MDNFKAFQLTTEQATKVTGQGRGRRGQHKGGLGKKKGHQRGFIKGLSEEDRTTIKTAITELKAGEGWADLAREDKRTQINAILEPYKG